MARLAVALACLLTLHFASGRVVMLYSVERHGARNVLRKTDLLQESDSRGGPTLLPEGQLQAYTAGVGYAARYLGQNCTLSQTCILGTPANDGAAVYGVVNTPGISFSNYNLLARSSALDRTIMTARSFLDGAFPPLNDHTATRFLPDGQQVIPVFNYPDVDDIVIRAYTKCDAYQQRLEEWYQSEEFKAKEAETKPVRDAVSAVDPTLDTDLTNWWNVFDGFNVWRTYGVGDPTPNITDDLFSQMKDIAYWLETAKMRSDLAGNLLGGAMLADMTDYIGQAVNATAQGLQVYYKLLHVSGHYNTQLGLLAALAVDKGPQAANITWLKKIPSLAAIMVLELHTSLPEGKQDPQYQLSGTLSAQYAVRLVYQDGPDAEYETLPLPCAKAGDNAEQMAGPGACTLDAFLSIANPQALSNDQWCAACQDNSTSFCQLSDANRRLATTEAQLAQVENTDNTDNASTSGSGGSSDAWKIAVAAVVTGVGVAALCGAAFALYVRRQRRQAAHAQLQSAQDFNKLPMNA